MIRAFDPFHEELTLADLDKGNFVCMNAPGNKTLFELSPIDEWVVQVRKDRDAQTDFRCHFLLEEAGYLLNRVRII